MLGFQIPILRTTLPDRISAKKKKRTKRLGDSIIMFFGIILVQQKRLDGRISHVWIEMLQFEQAGEKTLRTSH